MAIVDEISAMTVRMEAGEDVIYQDIYIMLLRSLIEIKQLNHSIAILESKV